MNLGESFKIAMKSIRSNLMRSLLTMLGIIIGISSVIMIVGVGNGGRDFIIDMIESMGSNAVNITVDVAKAQSADYITFDDVKAIKEKVPGASYVSPMLIGFGSAKLAENDMGKQAMALMTGGSPDLQYAMTTKFEYGRFYSQEEYDAGRPVCVINTQSAEDLFGYTDVVGKYINISSGDTSMKFKIVGVSSIEGMASSASSSGMMSGLMGGSDTTTVILSVPASTLMTLTGLKEEMNSVYVIADTPEELNTVGNATVNFLKARHANADRDVYQAQNMATYIDLLDQVIGMFTKLIACVGAVSLLVGGIGVMNIMLVSVTERTREIGIRKSLGARTNTIMSQFLTESVIICLIGGIIGVILGVLGAYIGGAVISIKPAITFGTILIALVFSSGVGVFFGIYPARKAAKMNPIDALRQN